MLYALIGMSYSPLRLDRDENLVWVCISMANNFLMALVLSFEIGIN